MQSYTDWKPIDLTIHTCYKCGFYIRNEVCFMTLDELNEDRLNVLEIDKPLKELPKQNKSCLYQSKMETKGKQKGTNDTI